jgi:hypothetical protein
MKLIVHYLTPIKKNAMAAGLFKLLTTEEYNNGCKKKY